MKNTSNLLDLDYAKEAGTFKGWHGKIIDVHSHIQGTVAPMLFKQVADLYGIQKIFSMTMLEEAEIVKEILGDRIEFIAVPLFGGKDRRHEFGPGYKLRIKEFHRLGSTIAKFWNAPRIYEAASEPFATTHFRLNSPERLEVMKYAAGLGMNFMVHVSDPDTWFQTKYLDSNKYGTKLEQYEPLEEILEMFAVKVIAAHMGGSPENLTFLGGSLGQAPKSLYRYKCNEMGRARVKQTPP